MLCSSVHPNGLQFTEPLRGPTALNSELCRCPGDERIKQIDKDIRALAYTLAHRAGMSTEHGAEKNLHQTKLRALLGSLRDLARLVKLCAYSTALQSPSLRVEDGSGQEKRSSEAKPFTVIAEVRDLRSSDLSRSIAAVCGGFAGTSLNKNSFHK
ncbi:hypothetical protein MHYP_G00032210 [Metynnis hypsauchen]